MSALRGVRGSGLLPETRVLVCGGRNYGIHRHDFNHERFMRAEIDRVLDEAHKELGIGCIIQGAGGNADFLASQWAQHHAIPCLSWPARWTAEGNAGGPMRNARMLTLRPQLVIAMPGGDGTRDMVAQATKAGVPVWTYSTSKRFSMPEAP